MRDLAITTDYANIDTRYHDSQIEVVLSNPHMGFLINIDIEDIIKPLRQ